MTASRVVTPSGDPKSMPLDGSASSSEDDSEGAVTMASHGGTGTLNRVYKKDE